MTENICRYGDDREEQLLAYLYDELDAPARGAFAAHLKQCDTCRQELDGLRTVRTQLAAWEPPVVSRESSVVSHSRQAWWLALPAWAQVAAALLFLGISAGLANLNVHYDQSGLTVRTGWASPSRATATTASAPAAATTTAPAPAAPAAATTQIPWRADLTALERQLRTEMRASAQPAALPASTDAETLRRVRAMIDDSERRQQRDLALRVAEVMRDVDVQRRADLTRISQSLGQIQSNTGMEVMKQRQLLNYLVTVSQKQP